MFQLLRSPLPWMTGPLAAMAMLKFSGVRLRAPRGGRELGQLVIGTALGLYFTPQVAREVLSTWPVLIAAALLATALGWICALFLSRFTGTDRTTAFFASVPGGATEMAILGERFGAKIDRIALTQSLRIMMVVVIIPFALTFLDVHGADAYTPVLTPPSVAGITQLLALGLLGGALLAWLAPLLAALEPRARADFESEYRRRMARAYPRQPDGKTLFPFRRLFIVAGF